jgi:two-component system NtrC family response regulator
MTENIHSITGRSTGRVLVIDDDTGMSYTLSRMVQETGHVVKSAFTIAEGLAMARSAEFDVVFLDVRLPDGSGLDLIPKLQALPFPPEIIIITAFGERNGASEALKSGVWDYIEKPSRIDTMKLSLLRALEYRNQKKVLKTPLAIDRSGIIGSSPKLQMCLTLMAHAAKSDTDVLIKGETGTGKELFARAIHHNSARAAYPFVVVDCTALPKHLAESELFGHTKGAFTGADKQHDGLIRQANGGTLFLDEVGELPLDLQKTFLRVLEERRYRPVGSNRELESNFRLVSATNRDLDAEVEQGRFRNDLLFRLGAFFLELPTLRERIRDIEEIAAYYVERICRSCGGEAKSMSEEFLALLHRYPWPGNVRELVSVLERAIVVEPESPSLYPKHLPDHIRFTALSVGETGGSAPEPAAASSESPSASTLTTWKEYRQRAMAQVERVYMERLMRETNGDIHTACAVSGLKRARLYQLLNKERREKRSEEKESGDQGGEDVDPFKRQ